VLLTQNHKKDWGWGGRGAKKKKAEKEEKGLFLLFYVQLVPTKNTMRAK